MKIPIEPALDDGGSVIESFQRFINRVYGLNSRSIPVRVTELDHRPGTQDVKREKPDSGPDNPVAKKTAAPLLAVRMCLSLIHAADYMPASRFTHHVSRIMHLFALNPSANHKPPTFHVE